MFTIWFSSMKLVASPTVAPGTVSWSKSDVSMNTKSAPSWYKVLVVAAVNRGGFDLEPGVEGLVDHLAGHHVAHLGAHERATLAGLDVLELNDVPELALKLQDRSVLDVVSGCHCILWFRL